MAQTQANVEETHPSIATPRTETKGWDLFYDTCGKIQKLVDEGSFELRDFLSREAIEWWAAKKTQITTTKRAEELTANLAQARRAILLKLTEEERTTLGFSARLSHNPTYIPKHASET